MSNQTNSKCEGCYYMGISGCYRYCNTEKECIRNNLKYEKYEEQMMRDENKNHENGSNENTVDTVISFIEHFQNEGTIETFMNGCCYWFAVILLERFTIFDNHVVNIYYNQILGHFATWIDGKLYDITGEIEKTDDWLPWVKWAANEPVYGQVVVRDCILKKNIEQ